MRPASWVTDEGRSWGSRRRAFLEVVTFGQALKEEGKAGEGFIGRRNRIGRSLEEKENTESRGWAERGHSVQCMVVGHQKGKGAWDPKRSF